MKKISLNITQFSIGTGKFLLWFLTWLFESLEVLIQSKTPQKESYEATFLPSYELLSSFNKGFCLTGIKSLTVKDSYQHSLVIGGSGTGKSTVVIIPSIYSMTKHGHSLVIQDPSGELHQATAGYLKNLEYDVLVLDYNKPEMSDGYNPLERIKTNSDIFKTATTLVQNSLGKSGTDAFWNSQAVSFISLMIAILKKQDAKYQTLTNVKHLVDSFLSETEMMDRLVAGCCDPATLKEYKSFLVTEKKVMANIISTCRSTLQLFSDESVQLVTSEDTINFNKFREKKTALFIMNKTADLSYYAPLTSTFFLQFFNHIMNQPIPDNKARSIFLLIDETSSLFLPGTLQIALANLRKYKTGLMLVIQDFNQLIHLYGKNEAEAIRANCFATIYLTAQPIETCQTIEAMLGKREYDDKDGHKQTRALLTADEIRTMDKDHALIFCGAHRAIHAYMKPYYKRLQFSKYSKIPVPDMNRNLMPFSTVPVIGQ
ncbi:MAG: type IV secretory system conjugative DNA transfer family protein [Bacteroidota bacterium]|nr:type IV secretory system conjugative DNA transfer family protein [Bacteroidota bacterium]